VLATSLLKFDPAIPHITIKFGRGQAWWAYALLAAYTTTKDDSLRANLRPNFDIAIQALEKAIVPCSGVFNGVVNKDTNNLFVSAHNYEKAFAELVMGGVENKVYANTGLPEAAPLDSFLTTAAKTPLRRGYALVTKFWKSMRRLLIVADKNNPTNVYCAVSQMPAAARPFTNNKPDSGEAMLAFTLNAEKNPSKAHLYSKIADMKLGGISNAPDLLGKLEEYKNQHGKLIGQISAMTGQLLACVQNGLCPN